MNERTESGRGRGIAGKGVRGSVRWGMVAGMVFGGVVVDAQERTGEGGGGQVVGQSTVDPAGKRLAAANGLFQRQLFKLAADEYAGFLKEFPNHSEAVVARYALAVCRYRVNDFAGAVE